MTTHEVPPMPAVDSPVERGGMPRADDVLHCYAQHSWHTEAYISGTREALEALRAAIDRALVDEVSECQAFAADGEGYTVYVVAMSVADAERQVVPYTSDIAAQPWSGQAFGPWDAVKRHNV